MRRTPSLSLLLAVVLLSWCLSFESVSRVAGGARSTDGAHLVRLGCLQRLPTRPTSHAQAANRTEEAQYAAEMFVAMELAVRAINTDAFASLGLTYLAGLTLQLDAVDTNSDATQATIAAEALLSPANNPTPPAIVLGLIDYDETYTIGQVSQLYQVPLLSGSISTPSLTAYFPNFARYTNTDEFEIFSHLALMNTFGWTKVYVIYNNDAGTAESVTALQNSAPNVSPNLVVSTLGYTQSIDGSTKFPSLADGLRRISASGVRILLLACPSADVFPILLQAKEFGLVGAPYQIMGIGAWCYDRSLYEDATYGYLLDGAICTENYQDNNSQVHGIFESAWAAAYAADPASTYYLATPTRATAAAAFDTVLGAAQAIQTLVDLRTACNITADQGDASTSPFSGLIAPQPLEYVPSLYRGTVSASDSLMLAFVESTFSTKSPGVCPYLLYTVGQGRVLSALLRNQVVQGATGNVSMKNSGDRVGDFTIYNIYDGKRLKVGRAEASLMFEQFGMGASGKNATFNGTTIAVGTATATGGAAAAGGPPGAATTTATSTNWRLTYNATSFRPTGAYSTMTISLSLATGGTFDSNVIAEWTPTAVRFADGTANVPLDSPIEVMRIQSVSTGARIAILVLVGLVGLYNLSLLAFQIYHRRAALIKQTSPWFNVCFLVGSALVLVYVVLLAYDSDMIGGESAYVRLCYLKNSSLSLAFTLSFGSLVSKTYRLDAIFNAKHLRVRIVRDWDILLIVLGLVCVDVLLLCLFGALSPFRRRLESDAAHVDTGAGGDINHLIAASRDFCDSDQFALFVAVHLVYKGILLVFGLYLALRIRKIRIPNLNDAAYICGAIYQTVVLSCLIVPVSYVVQSNVNAFYLLVSIGLLFLVAVVLSVLFLPRVLTIVFAYDFTGGGAAGEAQLTGVHQTHTMSAADSDETDKLKAENARLARRVAELQHTIFNAAPQPRPTGMGGSAALSPSASGTNPPKRVAPSFVLGSAVTTARTRVTGSPSHQPTYPVHGRGTSSFSVGAAGTDRAHAGAAVGTGAGDPSLPATESASTSTGDGDAGLASPSANRDPYGGVTSDPDGASAESNAGDTSASVLPGHVLSE